MVRFRTRRVLCHLSCLLYIAIRAVNADVQFQDSRAAGAEGVKREEVVGGEASGDRQVRVRGWSRCRSKIFPSRELNESINGAIFTTCVKVVNFAGSTTAKNKPANYSRNTVFWVVRPDMSG